MEKLLILAFITIKFIEIFVKSLKKKCMEMVWLCDEEMQVSRICFLHVPIL